MGLFRDGDMPGLYLIRSTAWTHPDGLFVVRNYEGLKSRPEWGLNLSGRNMPLLEPHEFQRIVGRL